MTEEPADAQAVQTRASDAKRKLWAAIAVLALSLLGLTTSLVFGGQFMTILVALFATVSGVGAFIAKSRYDDAIVDLEDTCIREAEREISNGRAAIRGGSIDDAESAFERAAKLGELGFSHTSVATEDVLSQAENEGVEEGLCLSYAVSNVYLDLIAQYRGSEYDYSDIDEQFTEISDAIESGSTAVAIEQLIEVAESLTTPFSGVNIFEQSSGYEAINELTAEQEKTLREAGYDDPVRTASVSATTVAAILDIEQQESRSIKSGCASLTANPAFIGQLAEDASTLDAYRERWNGLAVQVRDAVLTETAHTLNAGLADFPNFQRIGPAQMADLRDPLHDTRMRAIRTLEPITSLHQSVGSQGWVSVNLQIVEPVLSLHGSEAAELEYRGHEFSIATASTEAISSEFGVSQDRAMEAREEAISRLTGRETQHEQLRTAVSELAAYHQAFDYIDEWNVFDETVQEAESCLASASETPYSNPTETNEALSEARYQIGRLESILDTTAFPDLLCSALDKKRRGLVDQLTEVETTIRNQQRELLADTQDLLEQAEQEAESGNLESARTALSEAQDTFSKAESIVESDDLGDVEDEVRRVGSKVTVPYFKEQISTLNAEVDTVRENIGADISSARSQLAAVESSLDELQSDVAHDVRGQEQTRELLHSIGRVRLDAANVEHEITRQEAEQVLADVWETINRSESLLQDGQIEQAESVIEQANSHLPAEIPALEESRIEEARTAIEGVEEEISINELQATIEDVESTIKSVGEESVDDIASREETLDSVGPKVDILRQDIQNEISREGKRNELCRRVDAIEQSIADVERQLTIERQSKLLDEANGLLEDARASIEASELEGVSATIEVAESKVLDVNVEELDVEIEAFYEDIAAVRAELHEARITHALDETKHELRRAKGYLQHDVDDTRERLRAARLHLKASVFLTEILSIPDATREALLERAGRHRSEIQTLAERCHEREISESIEAAKDPIERARTAFEDENITDARDYAREAATRIQSIPDKAPSTRIASVQDDLETVEKSIARYEIGEYIENAEATVDQAEAERAAGEAVNAIEAYQRAISTYEAAEAEAKALSIPETYEIEVRTDQLTNEIANVKDQWTETRTQQIDRELRAGERAIAQGLDAVRRGNLDTAEDKYDTADKAADAAKTLLDDTPKDPAGGEFTLPATLDSEYQSAYSSLVGHLGYLRTQIQETKDSRTGGDTRATPLAEYYDGLYTVYRALPDNVHPVWHEALSAVLFGGDGLTDGAIGYGTQQTDRNETPIATLREENGDGEQITDFECIQAAPPRDQDAELIDSQQQLPVAPESGTVLPVNVDSDSVTEAIELLAEFPPAPEADGGDHDLDSVIDVEYFENRLTTEANHSGGSSAEDTGAANGKSGELESLMDEIEAEINDLTDA